jgi:hypothetical protein
LENGNRHGENRKEKLENGPAAQSPVTLPLPFFYFLYSLFAFFCHLTLQEALLTLRRHATFPD